MLNHAFNLIQENIKMAPKSVIDCCKVLLEKKLTIAFAESATTGRLVYEFTSVPNCGWINRGSIVCYDRSVKETLMNIPAEIIDEYTAESPEVTMHLALALNKLIPADVMVAVTGLASEGGSESEEKPVGTMFAHAIIKGKHWKSRMLFKGSPDEIIMQTIEAVASKLAERLRSS
jgi:nicotinamide-nucleotide amidase